MRNPQQSKSRRAWISGLAVTIATAVSYMAFWRLAPGTTFIIGAVALVALVIAGWMLGAETTQRPEK